MGRSDLMRAFHYFFQRRDYTYTLQKEKDWKKTDKGKLSESVTWLRGRGEILGIPFFFFVYKKWNTEKKWEESSTESVHINKITTHKSHSGTRCDLCSKLNKRGREREREGEKEKKISEKEWYWCRMKLFQVLLTTTHTGQRLEANRTRVGHWEFGRNQT